MYSLEQIYAIGETPIRCDKCNRKLDIAQKQRKHINQCVDFAVYIYYCWKCKITYFKFTTLKTGLIDKASLSENKLYLGEEIDPMSRTSSLKRGEIKR